MSSYSGWEARGPYTESVFPRTQRMQQCGALNGFGRCLLGAVYKLGIVNQTPACYTPEPKLSCKPIDYCCWLGLGVDLQALPYNLTKDHGPGNWYPKIQFLWIYACIHFFFRGHSHGAICFVKTNPQREVLSARWHTKFRNPARFCLLVVVVCVPVCVCVWLVVLIMHFKKHCLFL